MTMEKGYTTLEPRLKSTAKPIDDVTKFVWEEDDYEFVEVYHEYSSEELDYRKRLEQAVAKKKLLEESPSRLDTVEIASAELGSMADTNATTVEELMSAVAELGTLVAQFTEGE